MLFLGGRNGRGSRPRAPPKGPSTSDNPSVSLRLTAPFTQGSLWGRGMRIAASALRASSQWQWFSVIPRPVCTLAVGIRPFYDGRGFGPPHERRGERHAEVVVPYGWLRKAPSTTPASRRAAERPHPRPRGTTKNQRKDHPKRGSAPATAWAALSEAESAERAVGQIRSLPDTLRVQHGAESPEV